MNVHMAESGPLETLRAIRALPAPAGRDPGIGLTASATATKPALAGRGLAGVLTKPITAARLYAALSMVTTRAGVDARSWAPAGC